MNKMYQLKAVLIITLFAATGIAATHITTTAGRNLKVLPKDISDQKLDSIMHSYNVALGVNCDFCHVKVKSKTFGQPDGIDFAADGEPMKENARDMMRMTIEINSKHFWYDKNQKPEYLKTITCKTCHRGEPFPPED